MSEDDILKQLREIFRGELSDLVRSLRKQRAIVLRPQSTDAERQEAMFEIYRAVHSLKGAARSVSEEGIAKICHELEDALGPARERKPLELDVVRDIVEHRLPELEQFVDADRDGEQDPVAKPEAEVSEETMRVPVGHVARLMRSCDELVGMVGGPNPAASVGGMVDFLERILTEINGDPTLSTVSSTSRSLREALRSCSRLTRMWALHESKARLERARLQRKIVEVGSQVRALRLLSAHDLCLSVERAALEQATAHGKPLAFEARGAETMLDREVLGRLRGPLLHLVHNAIDHGLEPPAERRALGKPALGRLALEIVRSDGEVSVALEDDGRGFAFEALVEAARARGLVGPDDELSIEEQADLAFVSGLSTRTAVSPTSGRGVGLDVVRQRVEELHGRISVATRRTEGSRIELRLPAELSAVTALTVVCNDARYLIPISAVERILRPSAEQVRTIEDGVWLTWKDGVIPLASLSAVLLGTETAPPAGVCLVLVHGERRVAAWVERVLDVTEALARVLNRRALGSRFVSSAVLSAEGSVTPILDVAALVRTVRPGRPTLHESAPPHRRILVVDDSITTRQLVRTILEAAGHEVLLAEDGEAAWRRLSGGAAFDLVVSDIEMPNLDGLQLLARVRSSVPLARTPFVLVTARQDDDDRRRAVELGADAYVVKSAFDQRNLIEIVEELLA